MSHAPERVWRRTRLVCLFTVVALCLGLLSAARAWGVQEHEVKAAMVFNLAKFVEWPPGAFADASAPLVLGLLEHDPLAGALEALAGKTVQGRRLIIKKTNRSDDLKKCQIVFLSEKKGLASVLSSLAGAPVLTITDKAENFYRMGGIVNLIMEDGKVKFQVNLGAARQSGLKISSQLLKLAIIVDG